MKSNLQYTLYIFIIKMAVMLKVPFVTCKDVARHITYNLKITVSEYYRAEELTSFAISSDFTLTVSGPEISSTP